MTVNCKNVMGRIGRCKAAQNVALGGARQSKVTHGGAGPRRAELSALQGIVGRCRTVQCLAGSGGARQRRHA
jgi:hypothetical protein